MVKTLEAMKARARPPRSSRRSSRSSGTSWTSPKLNQTSQLLAEGAEASGDARARARRQITAEPISGPFLKSDPSSGR